MSATVLTVALILLAVGSAAGRWRVLPVSKVDGDAGVTRGSAVMVVPVPAVSLRSGDTIFFTTEGKKGGTFRTVKGIADSWERQVELVSTDGQAETVQLPSGAWRVSREVPYLGLPFSLLAGPIQAILLVLNGVLLVAFGESKRRRPPSPDAPSQRSRRRRSPSVPRARVAAAAAISMVLTNVVLHLALLG